MFYPQKINSSYQEVTQQNGVSKNSIQQKYAVQNIIDQDKFMNGVIIAIKAQKYVVRSIVHDVKDIADKDVSEAYIRKVWEQFKKHGALQFTTQCKARMYTKHEATQLYESISKLYSTQTQEESIIPYIKKILQKNSVTRRMNLTFSQFEEVKGLDTEETYIMVKEAIESNQVSEDPQISTIIFIKKKNNQ